MNLFYSRGKHPPPVTLSVDQHRRIAERMRADGFDAKARPNGDRADVDFEDCSLRRSIFIQPCEVKADGSWSFENCRHITVHTKHRDGRYFTDAETQSFVRAVVAEMVLPTGWHVYKWATTL